MPGPADRSRRTGAALALIILVGSAVPAWAAVAAEKNPPPTDPCANAKTAEDAGTDGDGKGDSPTPDKDLHCGRVNGGSGTAKGDFNGDGVGDLAVGVPFDTRLGVKFAGAVNVIYGSVVDGLRATADQVLYSTTFSVPLSPDDHFGSALASGDFNGDSFSDLAIGIPDRDVPGFTDNGAVVIIDGSASGLNPNATRQLSMLGDAGGRVGAALTWADFNGDGFPDLAVGIPNRSTPDYGIHNICVLGPIVQAGEVQVFFGAASGLSRSRAQMLRKGDGACGPHEVHQGDKQPDFMHFGSVLAAGRFSGRAGVFIEAADLVVGVPNDPLSFCGNGPGCSDTPNAGSIDIIPGSPTGVVAGGSVRISQQLSGVSGAAENGDQFGRALAAGDFNGDGRSDIAVGVPFEDLPNSADAGAVQVFKGIGGAFLVDFSHGLFITQGDLSGQTVEGDDRFGYALAAGGFNSGTFADLAIGAPHEDIGSFSNTGQVSALYGSANGLLFAGAQDWSQGSPGVGAANEAGDQFGTSLSAWDYGHSTQSDLAIGIPFEDLFSPDGKALADAGMVSVIYGTANGLNATTPPAQVWHREIAGIEDSAQPLDRFGFTLY
jgi:hypothetical protein